MCKGEKCQVLGCSLRTCDHLAATSRGQSRRGRREHVLLQRRAHAASATVYSGNHACVHAYMRLTWRDFCFRLHLQCLRGARAAEVQLIGPGSGCVRTVRTMILHQTHRISVRVRPDQSWGRNDPMPPQQWIRCATLQQAMRWQRLASHLPRPYSQGIHLRMTPLLIVFAFVPLRRDTGAALRRQSAWKALWVRTLHEEHEALQLGALMNAKHFPAG